MERLVQLPELRILDGREDQIQTAQDQGYALRCKIAGRTQAPICHLHLTETHSHEVIWSTRQPLDADRVYEELPVVADIAASAVLTAVERREHARLSLRNAPPESAYDYYLAAKDRFFRADQPDYIVQVEQLLERARAADPQFEPAYTHLIQSYNSMRFLSEPGRDFAPGRARALTLARKLLAINAQHPNGHIAMAWCQIWRKNYALAERHIERALALGAYESHRLNAIGTALVYLGRLEEGEACYDQAQDRMLHAFEYQRTDYGELCYLQGAFEDALSWLQTGERHAPFRCHFWRALAHAQLGQLVAAQQALDDMVHSAAPQWCGDQPITAARLIGWYMDGLPLRRQVDQDLLMDGLHKAGVTLAPTDPVHPE
jgi:tetratricopeptide (TPR) repeat protein